MNHHTFSCLIWCSLPKATIFVREHNVAVFHMNSGQYQENQGCTLSWVFFFYVAHNGKCERLGILCFWLVPVQSVQQHEVNNTAVMQQLCYMIIQKVLFAAAAILDRCPIIASPLQLNILFLFIASLKIPEKIALFTHRLFNILPALCTVGLFSGPTDKSPSLGSHIKGNLQIFIDITLLQCMFETVLN